MSATIQNNTQEEVPSYTLWQLVLYMLKLGSIGFGGPVALVGYMHRDLVDERGWISEADYREGLTLSQLAPGPLAAQLAVYMGYVHYKILGATLVGIAFVIPSFLMVLGIGAAYVAYEGLTWVPSIFYGVGAAVIGIIAISAKKLTEKNVGKDKPLWAFFAASAVFTIVTESESALLVLTAGLVFWLIRVPPKSLGGGNTMLGAAAIPAAASMASIGTLGQIALFFSKAGAFVFGSGLAIVPFLYGGVVAEHGWLTERQFVDAVAVAMITPGPVVITVGFIGYLIAGLPGAIVATAATFLPCYLLTIIPAPYLRKYGKHPAIVAFVDGVTAAAIGAIAGAVVVLGQRAIVDIPTAVIAIATALLLWKVKGLKEPVIILAAAVLGLALFPLTHG